MITKRSGRLVAVLAVAAMAFTACSSSGASTAPSAAAPSAAAPSAAAPSAAAGGTSVTFIPKQINNPYFDAAKQGADKAAAELGGTVTQVGPSAATEAQASFIQDATTQGVGAIAISANDPDSVVPALTAAKTAGIKVVGYDSSPAEGAYDVFVNQTDFGLIGQAMADWACNLAPSCTGEIAVLSAAATATNQNAWIDGMTKILAGDAKYAGLKLVDTVYGDDDPQKSTTQAQGLLQAHPNLKVIIAPTTVGILAAAQVVSQAGKSADVKVTGLGFPKQMASFVKDGTTPEFGLWSVPDLGYLTFAIADQLVKGTIKGTEGETITVPNLAGSPFTIGPKNTVILGPPLTFNAENIDANDWGPTVGG